MTEQVEQIQVPVTLNLDNQTVLGVLVTSKNYEQYLAQTMAEKTSILLTGTLSFRTVGEEQTQQVNIKQLSFQPCEQLKMKRSDEVEPQSTEKDIVIPVDEKEEP